MKGYIIIRHYDAYSKVLAIATSEDLAKTIIVDHLLETNNIPIAAGFYYEDKYLSSKDYSNKKVYFEALQNYLYDKLNKDIDAFEKYIEILNAPIIENMGQLLDKKD